MHAGLEPAAARSRRITPKPVPCASCRSTIASPMVYLSHAESASSSVAAVATSSPRCGTETSSTRRSAICGESSTTSAFIISSSRVRGSYSEGRVRPWGPSCEAGLGICAAGFACQGAARGSISGMSWASGDELILHRVVGDVRIRFEVHLLEDAGTVRAHRLHAEEELLGDLGDALARRELAEDLELPLGELRVRRLVRRRTREALRELVRDARAHVAASLRRGDDRRDHVF